jgi:arylformamidase
MAAVDYEAEYNNRARVPDHAETWRQGTAQTRYQELPGNHFTAIDPLADPSSAMVARIAELTQQVSR